MLIGQDRKSLEALKVEFSAQMDFKSFWEHTLRDFLPAEPEFTLTPLVTPMTLVRVFDISAKGYNGDLIRGWFLEPQDGSQETPCVVFFDGYGGGRGLPHEWLFWVNVGYRVLVMDTRGQGGGFRLSDTPDGPYPNGPQSPGFMTRGILNKNDYYYRRVYTDAVAFVALAQQLPGVSQNHIIVAGGSQGGGIALAAASLSPHVFAVLADVPFLCHFKRATEMVDTYPYQEIAQFCRIHRDKIDVVFETLSYFDNLNLVQWATAPALFSIGMHDPICPADTIFAARNNYAGPTTTSIYEYNTHEGGSVAHQLVQAEWIADLIRKGTS
jgi:cephalosporin-C deacetylase